MLWFLIARVLIFAILLHSARVRQRQHQHQCRFVSSRGCFRSSSCLFIIRSFCLVHGQRPTAVALPWTLASFRFHGSFFSFRAPKWWSSPSIRSPFPPPLFFMSFIHRTLPLPPPLLSRPTSPLLRVFNARCHHLSCCSHPCHLSFSSLPSFYSLAFLACLLNSFLLLFFIFFFFFSSSSSSSSPSYSFSFSFTSRPQNMFWSTRCWSWRRLRSATSSR